jgi:hypothetical protein
MDRARVVAVRWLAGTLGLLVACGPAPAAGARPASPPLRASLVTDVGSGFTVSFDGPPADASFAAGWPDPGAVASVLAAGAGAAATYERAWRDRNDGNAVKIVLLRFSSAATVGTFTTRADRTLESSAVVSSGPLHGVPGARLSTYVRSAGFGQAVVLRVGDTVALLSFLSGGTRRVTAITAADAERVSGAQRSALANSAFGPVAVAKNSPTVRDLAWAALAVGVLAAGLVTPLVLRRRRERGLAAGGPGAGAGTGGGPAVPGGSSSRAPRQGWHRRKVSPDGAEGQPGASTAWGQAAPQARRAMYRTASSFLTTELPHSSLIIRSRAAYS